MAGRPCGRRAASRSVPSLRSARVTGFAVRVQDRRRSINSPSPASHRLCLPAGLAHDRHRGQSVVDQLDNHREHNRNGRGGLADCSHRDRSDDRYEVDADGDTEALGHLADMVFGDICFRGKADIRKFGRTILR